MKCQRLLSRKNINLSFVVFARISMIHEGIGEN